MPLKIKLSIIIPAFNMQGYIGKCIRSCLDQDLPNNEFEIIIINDGSTDKTLMFINEYVSKYPNIHVISKKNEGVSQARNEGIAAAKGEYIWFVDADDWIKKNCFSKIYSVSSFCDLDLLWFKLERYREDGTLIAINNDARSDSPDVYTGPQFLDLIMGYSAYSVLFVIKRQFLIKSNIRFVKGIKYYEDAEFIIRLVLKAYRVKYEPWVYYSYLLRNTSAIQNTDPQKIDDLIYVILSLKNSLESHYNIKNVEYSNILISKMIIDGVKLVSNPEYKAKQTQLIKFLDKHHLTKVAVFGTVNQKMQAFIYNSSPMHFLKLCIHLRGIYKLFDKLIRYLQIIF